MHLVATWGHSSRTHRTTVTILLLRSRSIFLRSVALPKDHPPPPHQFFSFLRFSFIASLHCYQDGKKEAITSQDWRNILGVFISVIAITLSYMDKIKRREVHIYISKMQHFFKKKSWHLLVQIFVPCIIFTFQIGCQHFLQCTLSWALHLCATICSYFKVNPTWPWYEGVSLSLCPQALNVQCCPWNNYFYNQLFQKKIMYDTLGWWIWKRFEAIEPGNLWDYLG